MLSHRSLAPHSSALEAGSLTRDPDNLKTLLQQGLQQPTQVDKLLHEFACTTGELPPDAAPLRDRSELPTALRRLTTMATNVGQSWDAWADGLGHVWLFVGEISLPQSRERGAPVLQVDVYNEVGEMLEAGRWLPDHHGRWRRCAE
jgi:hypothetical protein